MANTTGVSGQPCICTAPAHWDLLLLPPRRYGVSLHFRALLDFCFSSARSWRHPPELRFPLHHSHRCYGEGETEAGRCHDLLYVHEDQERRVAACLTSLLHSWSSGASHAHQAPEVLGVRSWICPEAQSLLFQGHDYPANICADNS